MESSSLLYREFSAYLKEKYGEKVYKLPVNMPGTCPNRDGTLGYGGCIYCDEEGSGFECLDNNLSVSQQLAENKVFFRERFGAQKFIAYFQSFTNTYLPLPEFKRRIEEACQQEGLVGLAVSTRPDCVHDSYLSFLKEAAAEKELDVTIELGLQTVNYHTLMKVKRGHTLAEFIDAALRIHKYGFSVCAHLILNLPWDNELDAVENAKILSALRIEFVKLHSLYIVKGTELGHRYEKGELDIIPLEEYVNRVILFLEHASPHMIVERLVGKGPLGKVLFCNWNTSWWKIKGMIEKEMKEKNTFQGRKYKCLNGGALPQSFRQGPEE